MITRAEFYIGILIIAGLVAYLLYGTRAEYEIEKAKIEAQDSILTIQRDSALAMAMKKDMKSDSLMKVVERQNEDLKKVHEKYIYIKENIVRLNADSSLAWFLRAVR